MSSTCRAEPDRRNNVFASSLGSKQRSIDMAPVAFVDRPGGHSSHLAGGPTVKYVPFEHEQAVPFSEDVAPAGHKEHASLPSRALKVPPVHISQDSKPPCDWKSSKPTGQTPDAQSIPKKWGLHMHLPSPMMRDTV